MTTTTDVGARIRRGTEKFVATAAQMSDSQWTYRPSGNAWSASEVTEHVAIANTGVLGVLTTSLKTPLQQPLGVDDDEIPFLFYRGDEPPNVAAPTGTWTDMTVAATKLEASASAVIDWADATNLELRAYGCAHPVFGTMDGIQWLLFVIAHTERHRAQLLGLQRHPDIP